MKKIIIFEDNPDIDKIKSEISLTLDTFTIENNNQKEILRIINKNKSNAAIFINKELNVNLIYKKLGGINVVKNFLLDLIILEKHNIRPSSPNFLSKTIPFGEKNDNVKLGKNGIVFSDELKFKFLIEKIDFLSKDDFLGKIKEFENKWGYYNFDQKRIELNKVVSLPKVKNAIENKSNLPGIGKIQSGKLEDGVLEIKTHEANIYGQVDGDFVTLIAISKSDHEVNSFYNNKSILNNLTNHLYDVKNDTKRKIKKSEITLSSIGFIIFILLTIATFSLILHPDDVEQSFEILFSGKTWSHVWIYLLWINFVTSFMFSFLMMYFVSFMVSGKKPNAQNIFTYFVAAQIKATTRFITGEEIIGTILWGWYISKKNNIRVSSLVGGVASVSIIRGVIVMLVGIPFMVSGQFYLNNVFDYVYGGSINGINNSLFFFLSWGGFIYTLFDQFMTSFIVFVPPVHYVYSRIYTRILLFKKNPNIIDVSNNREMSLKSLKNSFTGILGNKERLTRISLAVILMIFIEALELMYIFNIVEDYNALGFDPITHSNFFQISSGRYMITQVRKFPIINITPGSGMGFIEYFMSNTYESMYIFSHKLVNGETGLLVNGAQEAAQSFANQTTFITRFFNAYLQRTLSLLITLYVLGKYILRRKL